MWNKEMEEILIKVKDYICDIAKMANINYSEGIGKLIVMVDTNFIGWGIVLFQIQKGKRIPIRFEGGI